MKKIYIFAILIVSVFLWGCGKDNSETNKVSQKTSQKNSTATTATAAPKTIRIPDMEGKKLDAVKKKLDEMGINYKINSFEYSTKYGKNTVMEILPSVVTEGEDQIVSVVVSAGYVYTVTDLKGKKFNEVKKELKKFKVTKKYSYSTLYEEEEIIDTSFQEGVEYKKGEKGYVVISNGKFDMEKALKQDVDAAKRQFKNANFKIKYKFSTKKKNRVLDVKVKTSKSKRVPVVFTLSDGNGVKVPNVVGKDYSEACETLDKKGIRYDIRYKYHNMKMDPAGGSDIVLKQSKVGVSKRSEKVILYINTSSIMFDSLKMHYDDFGQLLVDFKMYLTDDKPIKSLSIQFKFYDRVGEYVDESGYKWTGPYYGGLESFYTDTHIYDTTVAAVKPIRASVKFMDNSVQNLEFYGRYWHTSDYYGGDLEGY